MMRRVLVLVLLLGTLTVKAVVLQTKLGALRGVETTASNGRKVRVYKNVPFAAPPIGDLRWKMPQPPTRWDGVRDATQYSAACMSNSSTTTSPQKWVDEDCLYQNIFVGEKCTDHSPCPVVFYVHGGGLAYDSAVMFDDNVMVENFGSQDVVLVISAFRLGYTALLTFDNDDTVPRNLGVYDIVRGLEFVQDHIKEFGGDKKKVTILGHSWGATISTAFSFSKTINKGKKLFRGAIAMSPDLNLSKPEHLRNVTKEFMKRTGCSRPLLTGVLRDKAEMACLRTMDQMTLLRVQRSMEDDDSDQQFSGCLLIGPLFPADDIRDFQSQSSKVDLVIGSTLHEMEDKVDTRESIENIFSILGLRNTDELMEKYEEDVASGEYATNHSATTLAFYVTSWLYAQKMRSSGGRGFLYSYDMENHSKHTDDLSYVMGVHKFSHDENEQEIAKFYPRLFTNFTKTGEPSPEWAPIVPGLDNYFSVKVDKANGEGARMKLGYQHKIISYWQKMLAYDDALTKAKLAKQTVAGFRDLDVVPSDVTVNPSVDHLHSPSFWPYFSFSRFFMFMCVFLIGYAAGRLWWRDREERQGYVVLEDVGYQHNQHEKTGIF